jgi:hypothetical protein
LSKIGVSDIAHERITCTVAEEGDGAKLTFSGSIDMEDPSIILDPFFEQIHKGAVSSKIPQVTLDVKALEFLNSSGIKAFAKWIMKLQTVPEGDRYKILILQNKDISWQTTSLPTLTFLIPGIVSMG